MNLPRNEPPHTVRNFASCCEGDNSSKIENYPPAGWWILPFSVFGLIGWIAIIYFIWKWLT
jgi:hypothetical protein